MHSLGWCTNVVEPGQGGASYMVLPRHGMMALPPRPPALGYTLPANGCNCPDEQLVPAPCYPVVVQSSEETPGVDDQNVGIAGPLDRPRRSKRTRPKSLSGMEDSCDADNYSLNDPPMPSQNFRQLRHQSLPVVDLEEEKNYFLWCVVAETEGRVF